MKLVRRAAPAAFLASLALAIPAAAAAEPRPGGGGGPATKPAAPAAGPAEHADGLGFVLPEVRLEGVQLDDAIKYLQDVHPSFKAVVVRRGGAESPSLNLRLKNVTIGQVLDVITTAYPDQVYVSKVAGPTGVVHVITVRRPEGEAAGAAGAAADTGPAVRVYRLSGIVRKLTPRPAREELFGGGDFEQAAARRAAAEADQLKKEKGTLANVLSVIKAAIQTAGGQDGSNLQVHEETQTLIFKGPPEKRAVLEDVLWALEEDQAVRGVPSNVAAEIRDAGARDARAEADRVRQEADQAGAEVVRMRAELEKSRQAAATTQAELAATARQQEAQIKDLSEKLRNQTEFAEAVRRERDANDRQMRESDRRAGELIDKLLLGGEAAADESINARRANLMANLTTELQKLEQQYAPDHPRVQQVRQQLEARTAHDRAGRAGAATRPAGR